MKLAAEIVIGIVIYAWGGWAVWWVNRRLNLTALPSKTTRVSIRAFVGIMVFTVATAPLTYGLSPFFN
jgi:hypothetical protein